MLIKLWFYLTSIIKYFIVLVIISFIIAYFFPVAGVIVFILGLLGIFGAAKEDVEERYEEVLAKEEYKRKLKVAEESKYEFEGLIKH